jgi:hypothetical protein
MNFKNIINPGYNLFINFHLSYVVSLIVSSLLKNLNQTNLNIYFIINNNYWKFYKQNS